MIRSTLMLVLIITGSVTMFFCRARVSGRRANYTENIRGIIVTEILPVPDSTMKFTKQDTLAIPIYYYGKLTAYKLFYTLVKKWDEQGNIASKEEQYKCFVFAKDSLYGYVYDSYFPGKQEKVSVDSMIRNVIWCEQNSVNLYNSFTDNITLLLSSERSADESLLYEVYSYRRIKDPTRHGIFSLTFTNQLSDIPFSMSRELDSIKGMKLIATSAEGSFQYPKNGKMITDTAKTMSAMKVITVTAKDSLEIMQYFNRYQKAGVYDPD